MAETKHKRGFFAGLFRLIGTLLLIVVVLAAGLIGYLSVTEYRPADRETLTVKGEAARTLAAGEIDVAQFDGEWQFLMDEATPSCRSLDQPNKDADKAGFRYYLIDGFIVSGNLRVDAVETQDLDFAVSDHNPVLLQVTLQ